MGAREGGERGGGERGWRERGEREGGRAAERVGGAGHTYGKIKTQNTKGQHEI